MAKELRSLFVTLGLNDKDFLKGADRFQKTVRSWSKEMAIAGAAVTAALGLATKAALNEEVGINKLRQALQNAGADYAALSGEIEKNIAATQAKTNYGDGEQRDALAALVGITGTYTGALGQLTIATDLAAAKELDLVTASELVGRVVTGDTSMLKRYGIVVKEGSSAMQVLAQMQEKFGGAAEAAADPLKQLQNTEGDLVETVGGMLVPVLRAVVEKITPVIKGFQDWISEHPKLAQVMTVVAAAGGGLLTLFGGLGMALPTIAKGLNTVINLLHLKAVAVKIVTAVQWLWNAAMAANPIGLVIAGIAALTAAVYGLVRGFQWLLESTNDNEAAIVQLSRAEYEYQLNMQQASKKVADLTAKQAELTAQLDEAKKAYKDCNLEQTKWGDEVQQLEYNLANTNYELDGAKDKLEAIRRSYDAASATVKDFEDAIRDANNELSELTNPRLEGMQEFEDQIFDIEQQIKRAELGRNKIKLSNPEADTEPLDRQIEALKLQKENLQLQSELQYDPLLRGAKESVETIQGLNEEIAPADVFSRIAELGNQLGPEGSLTQGLNGAKSVMAEQNTALETQQGIVNGLEAAAKGYEDRLAEIRNLVMNINYAMITGLEEQRNIINEMLDDANELYKGILSSGPPVNNTPTGPPPSFAGWEGTVPGPKGKPYWAVVHGGETMISQKNSGGGSSSNVTININHPVVRDETDIKKIAQEVSREQYRMQQKRN